MVILRSTEDLGAIVDTFGGHGAENSTCNARVISSLCMHNGCIVSGSWDNTARVWRPTGKQLPEPPFELDGVLKGHTAAVHSTNARV